MKAGGLGATCEGDTDCDFTRLLECNRSTHKCEKTTLLSAGEACPTAFAQGAPMSCAKGSRGVRPSGDQPGTCVGPAKVGEACGSDKPCESFINCRQGKCVLPTDAACP